MKLFATLLLLSLILCQLAYTQKPVQISSPDHKINFLFRVQKGHMYYNVLFNKTTIIDHSPLGLQFDSADYENNIKAGKPGYRTASEDYELVVGKTSKVHHPYNEVTIPLQNKNNKRIDLIIRAFNDGLAFCYIFPQQNAWSSYALLSESSTFRFAGDPIVHCLFLPSYTTSHEGLYSTLKLSGIKEDTLMDMPALFELPGHLFVAITEASLLDYAGMYLVKHDGVLSSALSPLPGQKTIKVKAVLPHRTPWRVLMISDRIGSLIESNLLTSLSPACKIKDVSWIRPGKTTFPWWNGDVTPDTSFAPGNNFETNKYYIDFCARNHLEYHSVVEYGGHEWYMNDGDGFAPGPHADVLTPVPTLDMPAICSYARSKGVGIRVWVYWSALYPRLDAAFALYEKWGLKGLMVDFMDRDDQEMVNIQTEILQKAAEHHLHIQFHGAYKPTGLSRTYPNEFTREGTLNYEADKWNEEGISPDHDINMPFTRMLAGSTDYHLGGFRAVPPSRFKVQYTRPLVLGTRCHMLAMYVVLENYLGMVCDYPAAYEGQPGFDFLRQVPTTWDETKVLTAKIGEYIAIGRRKGSDWFVGMITNHDQRDLDIPLSFLDDGTYQLTAYTDAADTDVNPNHVQIKVEDHTKGETIRIHLNSGGGVALWFKRK